jgi:hypothetical protein
MNIPLCWLITMPIARPILKIDVLKMEHAFQMGYIGGGEGLFCFPHQLAR